MKRLHRVLPVAVLLAALAACSKVTSENYERLEAGQTYAEVTQILGDPDSCENALAFRSCTWGDADRYITVRFVGDAVVQFNAQNLR